MQNTYFTSTSFESIFKGLSGYTSYKHNEEQESTKQQVFLTYGEILYPGICTMVNTLNVSPNDIFMDLGSGIGKVALHFFIHSKAKKVVGWEFLLSRYKASIEAANRLYAQYPHIYANNRKLDFFNGNFLYADFSKPTIIFANSVCFSKELMQNLATIIDSHSNIHTVISAKHMPLKKLFLKQDLLLECSWKKDYTHCHVYKR